MANPKKTSFSGKYGKESAVVYKHGMSLKGNMKKVPLAKSG
jgi:hypothetical protein